MDTLWHIQLFGTFRAQRGQYILQRFPTQKTGSLLAYLALFPQNSHPREVLIEMLWPEVESHLSRNRFKQALASLRRQIEASGAASESLLSADRQSVRLLPQAFTTDVAAFQSALDHSASTATDAEKMALLHRAVELYQGELLPGFYEDWVLSERRRLADAYLGALRQLTALSRESADWEQAIDYAHRVIAMDYWQEEAHADLIRLYIALGRPAEALEQYHQLEQALLSDLGETPSAPLRALAEALRHNPRARVAARRPLSSPPSVQSIAPTENSVPEISPQEARPHPRLPLQWTRFFGREAEIERLMGMLGVQVFGYSGVQEEGEKAQGIRHKAQGERTIPNTQYPMPEHPIQNPKSTIQNPSHPLTTSSHHLITITGPGGTGKTRLALEVIRSLAVTSPESVWFVPLADLTQARQIPEAILEALGLQRSPDLEPLEQIVAFFHTRLGVLEDGKEDIQAENQKIRKPENEEEIEGKREEGRENKESRKAGNDSSFILHPSSFTPSPPPSLPPSSQRPNASTPSALLVLDNYEHLVEEGAMFVRLLRERVPSLVFLVTSRQPLGLEGEQEVALLPLPLPPASQPPERLMDYPSVQLFVDRAQARRVDFAITARNAETILALCSRLEGMPLSLELAASWARTLTPTQMLERLEQGLDLLVSHRKDIHPRHHSLAAAIEWSVRLLSPALQRLFLHLSVFRGGWTLEAAEEICAGVGCRVSGVGQESPVPNSMLSSPNDPSATSFSWEVSRHPTPDTRHPVLESLTQLCECSLILAEEQEGRMRFRMLETIRQYARQRLAADSEAGTLFRRHRDYYLALAARNNNAKQNKRAEITREYDNLRAALEWCLSEGSEREITLKLIRELGLYWGGYGFWEEGRGFIARLLSSPNPPLSQEQRAMALQIDASFAVRQGDPLAARALCEEALAIWEALGEKRNRAWVSNLLANISKDEGAYQTACTLYQNSLALYEEVEDSAPFIAGTLHNLGCLAQAEGDYAAAWEYQQQSLERYRALRQAGGIGICLGFLGEIARLREDYPTARSLLEESVAIFRQDEEKPRIAEMLTRLAAVVVLQQEWSRAQEILDEGMALLEALGDRPNSVLALEQRAALAAAGRHYERAARLYGAAHALRDEIRMPIPVGERSKYDQALTSLRKTLGEKGFTTHFESGRRLSWLEALRYAQSSG